MPTPITKAQHEPSDWIDPRHPPEIRLFFSVDIEGSTSFKHSASGGRSTWGPFYLDFFQSFPPTLAKSEVDLAALLQLGTDSSNFELWKTLGDELIFSKRLKTGFDVFVGLCAAREAVIQGSAKLRQHKEARSDSGDKDKYPIHLKGTAWLAGFPIKNMKISGARQLGDDYIGPSIDLGFRLAKMSSPWRIAVSTPLAWMAAKVQHEQSAKLKGQTLKWSYLGRQTLKGIEGDRAGYPVFCLDVADSATGLSGEELNLLDRGDVKARDVVAFCETQFRGVGNQAGKHGRPFILGDTDCDLAFPSTESPEYIKYIDDYKAFLTTQPVINRPVTTGRECGNSDAVMSAIDSAASNIARS